MLAIGLVSGCSGGRYYHVSVESKLVTQADRAEYFYRNAGVHEERGDLASAARNFCLAHEK
ncbi:MAG: hypothetical protein KAT39_15045, partial [Alphaproteobacteria bacterium]|nr:hypothetical protein [Alphaproteobacteria bacterium]